MDDTTPPESPNPTPPESPDPNPTPPSSPEHIPPASPATAASQPIPTAGPIKRKTPTFILVLCILTFVWSAYAIVVGIVNMASPADVAIAEAEMAISTLPYNTPPGMKKFLQETLDFAYASAPYKTVLDLGSLLIVLLSLMGAILMLKLRKVGFYIYTSVNIIQIFIPLMILVNSFSLMTSAVVGVFNILFIILYGVNRKYMS